MMITSKQAGGVLAALTLAGGAALYSLHESPPVPPPAPPAPPSAFSTELNWSHAPADLQRSREISTITAFEPTKSAATGPGGKMIFLTEKGAAKGVAMMLDYAPTLSTGKMTATITTNIADRWVVSIGTWTAPGVWTISTKLGERLCFPERPCLIEFQPPPPGGPMIRIAGDLGGETWWGQAVAKVGP